MNILHIDSSILHDNSVTRELSAVLAGRLLETQPDARVTYRDLAGDPLPHLSGAEFAARSTSETIEDPALAHDVAIATQVMREFLAADIIVLGAPMYNFGISSQLKAWIDRISVAGQSFSYGSNGPVGLAGGKTVYILSGRGSVFSHGGPMASFDHQEPYLRRLFGFLGIDDVRFVRAEGVGMGPDARRRAITDAREAIAALELTPIAANANDDDARHVA